MTSMLADRIHAFAGRRVLVLGEAMLDSYLRGMADRLSREAPVPIVTLQERVDAPGGAGNAAVNVASLGGRPLLVSVCGDDTEGDRLLAALAANDVSTAAVLIRADRTTLAKQRILAGDQVLVRFDSGTQERIGADAEDELIARLCAAHASADAVLVSDYDYGVVTERLLAVLAELQAARPLPLIVDARDLSRYRRLGATAVKPNYAEAVRLLGDRELRGTDARVHQVGTSGERLLESTGARIVAVTIDTDGSFVFERGNPPYRTYCRPHSHSRAAGAGDTFVAALTLALASGATVPEAAELASSAAAVVVAKDGTSTCTARELEASISTVGKRLVGGDGVAARDALAARLEFLRSQGRRIVFTNGCFDILHRGHITYLNRAKALGDVLIVGVNDDDSVRRLKGASRPINGLDDRLGVLEALSCVDLVVPFGEDTPVELLRVVRPHVFVKGGDYSLETLPEAPVVAELGGTIQILPYVEDRSTTGIIERVRSAGRTDRTGRTHGTGRPAGQRGWVPVGPGRRGDTG
ncbi:MAG TPA: D-glycero-beta-D-manno-heptose 1-phosphate adenylyltransferase [Candidatus Limnocylindrales bacterium]|nr:D-glycero-beta-D-manno-heptose 1-phosphate adenylyltransferase [Candidatus Limnocylindrales bacterium]